MTPSLKPAEPSLYPTAGHERNSAMHQTKKGKQYHFVLKVHVGVDSKGGVVHSVCASATAQSRELASSPIVPFFLLALALEINPVRNHMFRPILDNHCKYCLDN